jgi:hypothetical protein
MKGKHVLMTVAVLLAGGLIALNLYLFFSKSYGQYIFSLFYVAWAIAVFAIVKFYSADESDTYHEEHHHDSQVAQHGRH